MPTDCVSVESTDRSAFHSTVIDAVESTFRVAYFSTYGAAGSETQCRAYGSSEHTAIFAAVDRSEFSAVIRANESNNATVGSAKSSAHVLSKYTADKLPVCIALWTAV